MNFYQSMLRCFFCTAVCVAVVASGNPLVAQPEFTAERLVSGLNNTVYAGTSPGDPDRLFILEKQQSGIGRIRIFNLATNTLSSTPFLSISDVSSGGERGLLGLAFHPDYQNNGLFYVNVNTGSSGNATVIREYQRQTADLADVSSGRDLLVIPQPFSNHNGGWMEFGPNDGFLYIGSGDGGSGNDPGNNAQTITGNLLGKILRIDPLGDNSSNEQYGIPASNPFVGVTGDDEIWAYGLRNPWRCSFDSMTGDLYIGDVGQGDKEEIDVQAASSTGGENYGWKIREGTTGGSLPGAIDPVYDYDHGAGSNEGFSVTGGCVYRGPITAIQGHYFFADYVTDRIWSFRWDGSAASTHNGTNFTDFIDWSDNISTNTGESIDGISSFGKDSVGNLYIVSLGGRVYRITSAEIPTSVVGRKVLDGVNTAGSISDLNASNDTYLQYDPPATTNLFKQKIDMIVISEVEPNPPTDLAFRFETKMIGGPSGDVIQEVFLFNFNTGSFELVDNRAVEVSDTRVTVQAVGDVSRFVSSGPGEVIARLVWKSESFAGTPFAWSIDLDELVWIVQ